VCLALLPLGLLTSAATAAETHTFVKPEILYPTGGAGEVGPANHFPSTLSVSGIPGTVTNATVTLFIARMSNPDDDDVAITGPNGQQVMLMSDACGLTPIESADWTFSDAAASFVSNGGPRDTLGFREETFKPSNYLGNAPEPDDMSASGGPAGPFLNALSFFQGASADGDWKLWVLDDDASNGSGFDLTGWSLALDVEPPASPAGTAGLAPRKQRKCKKHRKKKGRGAARKKRCRKRRGPA
jgi:hypothetical protein